MGALVYLLAAGRGTRAGGPKAWINFKGKSLLERQIEFLLTLFKPGSIAVSIQTDWLDRCKKINKEICWTCANPDALALDSLQRLLKAKPMDQWGFVYHVDMPIWEPQLFQRLAGRAVKCGGGVKAVAPAYQGKGGHPVLLSPGLDKKLLALDPGKDRLDIWLKSQKIDRLEVPFPCVLENWNHLTALANIHSKE